MRAASWAVAPRFLPRVSTRGVAAGAAATPSAAPGAAAGGTQSAPATQPAGGAAQAPRRERERGSLIDHVWAAQECRCTHVHELSQLSDHRAIRVQCAGVGRAPPPKREWGWIRRWDRVEPDDVAAILAEEMPRAPDGDRLRARIAAEMCAQGIAPPPGARPPPGPERIAAA